jgi:anti-sigma B factor antagonist
VDRSIYSSIRGKCGNREMIQMSIKLKNSEKSSVVIVEVSGKLTLDDGTQALRSNIRMLVDGGFTRILLNMAGLNDIDSSGMGELIAAYTKLTAAGGEIKLLNLAKRPHDLLKITKLYTVFETFENEALAIASFSVASQVNLPSLDRAVTSIERMT